MIPRQGKRTCLKQFFDVDADRQGRALPVCMCVVHEKSVLLVLHKEFVSSCMEILSKALLEVVERCFKFLIRMFGIVCLPFTRKTRARHISNFACLLPSLPS